MNAKSYMAALSVSTAAALKSNQITLPEIVGLLEMTKINAERQAFQRAMAGHNGVEIIQASELPPSAGN